MVIFYTLDAETLLSRASIKTISLQPESPNSFRTLFTFSNSWAVKNKITLIALSVKFAFLYIYLILMFFLSFVFDASLNSISDEFLEPFDTL